MKSLFGGRALGAADGALEGLGAGGLAEGFGFGGETTAATDEDEDVTAGEMADGNAAGISVALSTGRSLDEGDPVAARIG